MPTKHQRVFASTSLLLASLLLIVACGREQATNTPAPPTEAPRTEDPALAHARTALELHYPWREWSNISCHPSKGGVDVSARYRTKEQEYVPWAKPLVGNWNPGDLFSMDVVLLESAQPAGSTGTLSGTLVLMHRAGLVTPTIPLPTDRPDTPNAVAGKSAEAAKAPKKYAMCGDVEKTLLELAPKRDALRAVVEVTSKKHASTWTGEAKFPTCTMPVRLQFKSVQSWECEFPGTGKRYQASGPAQLRLTDDGELSAFIGNRTNWSEPQKIAEIMQALLTDQPVAPSVNYIHSVKQSLFSGITVRLLDNRHIELSTLGFPPTVLTRQP